MVILFQLELNGFEWLTQIQKLLLWPIFTFKMLKYNNVSQEDV